MHRYLSPLSAVLVALTSSALLLAGAHAFERIGEMAPCILCLDQREAHWAALAVALVGLVAHRFLGFSEQFLAATLGGLTIVFLFSAGLAGYHAGVEWAFWEGPQACAASNVPNTAPAASDLLQELRSGETYSPSCTEAAWRLFGLSMAGYNAIISLALAVMSAVACYAAARTWGPVGSSQKEAPAE